MNGFQGPPAANFYAQLSGLGDTLQSNAKIAREQSLRDAFKDGLPRDADGAIDFSSIGTIASKHGADLGDVLKIAHLGEEQRKNRLELEASKNFRTGLSGIFGGTAPAAAAQPADRVPAATPGETSPAPRAPVQSTARVYGDREAEDAGLYEPAPKTRDFGESFGGKRPDPYAPLRTPAAPVASATPLAAPTTPQAQPAPSGFQGITMAHAPALAAALANPRLPAGDRDLAKTLLGKALDDAKDPERIRFLQGLKDHPELVDIEKSLRPQTNVNIDQRGETEEAKAAGKAAGERRAAMFAAANGATNNLSTLTRVQTLMDQVDQGKLAPGRMNMSAWGKSLGVNDDFLKGLGLDPKSVGTSQAVQSMVNELVLGKLGPGGFPSANFSDADRTFITDILPKLGNDPRANKILIEAARRVHQDSINRALQYQTWKEDPNNKTRSFEDFELHRAKHIAQMDRFGDLRKQAETLVPAEGTGGQIDAPGGPIQWRVK